MTTTTSTSAAYDAARAEIRERSPYAHVQAADVLHSTDTDTDGALWLLAVAESAVEAHERIAGGEDEYDVAHEVADSAVPIYTGERWAVFTDLGAWHEDVAEYTDCRDMTEVAGVALYLVAERLAVSIFAELNEASEDEKHVHGWDYAVGAHVCQQRGILADFCDVYDDEDGEV